MHLVKACVCWFHDRFFLRISISNFWTVSVSCRSELMVKLIHISWIKFTEDSNWKHAFFIHPIVKLPRLQWLLLKALCVSCGTMKCTTNRISEDINDWHRVEIYSTKPLLFSSVSHGFTTAQRWKHRTAVRRSGWDFWTCTETCTAESTATHAPSSSSTTWPNVRLCWPGYVNDSCCHMHLFPVLREQNMLTLCFLSRLVLSHALRADLERSSYLQGLWAALKICKCRLCKWGSWPCSKWSCFVIFSG